jgi:2-dehydropantoate 2-reductase
MTQSNSRIAVAGAGSIGGFVGGLLAAAGHEVALLARPRLIGEIAQHGLRLSSFEGLQLRVSPDRLTLSDQPEVLQSAEIVLVTVKSADTAAIGALIAQHAPPHAVVVSLQNGVGNVATLRSLLPGRTVLAGMVPFNVIGRDDGGFHRATSGDIVIEQDERGTAAALSVPGLAVRASADMVGVQWGKLLVNLNNALNALAGLPLRQQLAQRRWRRLFADQMAEGLAAIRAEGVTPVAATPLPPWLTPHLLRLPDSLFGLLLSRTMKIDPDARSSMWEDLQRRRTTEIDYLQGVIVGIADRHGLAAPLSRRVVALVKAAEAAGAGAPGLSADEIRGS